MRFFKCKKCGNVVALVDDKSNRLMCCGEEMVELNPSAEDAAVEKHVPKVFIDENEAARLLDKPRGSYLTLETPRLRQRDPDARLAVSGRFIVCSCR